MAEAFKRWSIIIVACVVIILIAFFLAVKFLWLSSTESKLPVVTKSLEGISENKTRISYVIESADESFFLVEEIPKSVAAHVSEIEFSIEPIIIEEDPVIVWYFDDIDDKPVIPFYTNEIPFYIIAIPKEEAIKLWENFNSSHRTIPAEEIETGRNCNSDEECDETEICMLFKCVQKSIFKCSPNCWEGEQPEFTAPIIIKQVFIKIMEESNKKADAIIEVKFSLTFFGKFWHWLRRKDYIREFVEETAQNLDAKLEIMENDFNKGRAIIKFYNFANVHEDNTYYTYNITAYPMEELIIRFPDCFEIKKNKTRFIKHIKHEVVGGNVLKGLSSIKELKNIG